MNRELTVAESQLSVCVRNSGTLPISLRGHYDHWQKYHGRGNTENDYGIKKYLKSLRVQRLFAQTKKRSNKDLKLPSLRSGLTTKTLSLKNRTQVDLFEMYNEMVDSGSNWWTGSPLPDILKGNFDIDIKEDGVQEPFYISPVNKVRVTPLSKPVRRINDRDVMELFPPRTLHIYVSSSESDMAIERKHLESTVWPHLRHLCLQYQRELIIHDLHTFSDELCSQGRNKYLDEINASLNQCLNNKSKHIKAVILFGDYFDKKGPPESISEEDMTTIKFKMQQDINEIKETQEKIQHLKLRQQQMKQQELRRSSTTDIFVDRERSDIDQLSGLSMNSENDWFNFEISALGRRIESLLYKTNASLIDQWYCKSPENNEIYSLQSEREIIKELKSTEPEKLKQGKMQWNNIKDQICHIITSYVEKLMMQQKSIFEHEINRLNELFKDNQCVLITRTFNNISSNEVIKSTKAKLISKINDNYQRRFELAANSRGMLSPKDTWEHASYLKHLSANLQNVLERNIIETIQKEEKDFKDKMKIQCKSSITKSDLLMLFSEHDAQLQKLNSNRSRGNKNVLPEIQKTVSQIKNLISTVKAATIVLTGPPVSGKSSIMVTMIEEYKKDVSGSGSLFVYRIIGSSFHSKSIVGLMRSICLQIIYETGIEMEVQHEYLALKTLLFQLAQMITCPVFIFIDGLDLLTDHATGSYDWLPALNNKFTLLLSCTTDTTAYKSVIGLMETNKTEYSLVHIPELHDKTIHTFVNDIIKLENLYLTIEQENILFQNCLSNKTIGFIDSNIRISKCWSTISSLPRLGPKFELNIHTFFGKLEDTYGEPIIRRLLGYITCFRDGCTVTELVDLMTMDDNVQKYLVTTLNTKDFRYTYGLLRYALCGLGELVDRFLDHSGLWTLTWKHSLYAKAATERYLLQKDKAPSYHVIITQYFLNNDKDQAILATITEEDAKPPNYSDFLVTQELLYNDIFDLTRNKFNFRKILQLPYHLVQSQNSKLAKLLCFFNFYWLQANLINFHYFKLLDDIKYAYSLEAEDLEFPILITTLELSRESLLRDPWQLTSQLLARITDIVRKDVESVEPQQFQNLEMLYKLLRRNDWLTSIVPSKSCMTTCEQNDYTTIGFHFGRITSILLNETSTMIFAATDTGTLYKWDVSKNQIMSIIIGVGNNIFQMILGNCDRTLITAMPESIEMWDLDKRVVMKTIMMLYDMYSMTISSDRTIFSTLFYGTFWIATWNMETTELITSAHLPVDASVNCDGQITTAAVCRNFTAIAAVKNDNKAILIDIRSGEINPKILKCKEEGSSVIHVAISPRYYVICSKGLSQKDFVSLINYIDLFDEEKLQLVRRIAGCTLDSTITLSINNVGSHAITVNSDVNMNISDISIWNLETEEHKHFAEIPVAFQHGQCSELSRIFLSHPRANVLYKTNILTSKSKVGDKKQNFVVEKYALHDSYAFVYAEDNSVIEVHNVMRNKVRGRKVLTLPDLADKTDIILSVDDKLVILSKRCFSPNLPDYKEVFQTIKIYDLTHGRLIKEKKDVVIFPSRKSEYLILNSDTLLGLSESRSNLVHWNINTAQFEGHIRRNKEICEIVSFPNENRRNTVDHVGRMVSSLERTAHELVIDSILVSGDMSVLVAAYFTRFLCVFSLTEKCHKVNLTSESSMLHLQTAAITIDGHYVVQNNYNDRTLRAYLTLWDVQTGDIVNFIPVSKNILSVTITGNAQFVGFIKENVGGFIWNTGNKEQSDFHLLPGSEYMSSTEYNSRHKMEFIKNDEVLLIFTDKGFHFWKISGTRSQRIGSFEPDYLIQSFTYCCQESLIAFLLKGSKELYTIKLVKQDNQMSSVKGSYLTYFEKGNPNHSDNEESLDD